MFLFLVPLLLGFTFNLASAFTTAFSRHWGVQCSSFISMILRDIFGIPVWLIGFLLALQAPSPVLFASKISTDVFGWLLIAIGGTTIIIALDTIRLQAVKPATSDALIQIGIYSFVSHPIHIGTFFEFLGLFFLKPSETVVLTCTLGIAWLLIQTFFEEFDLRQRMPEYRIYMNRVPRFLPRFRMR